MILQLTCIALMNASTVLEWWQVIDCWASSCTFPETVRTSRCHHCRTCNSLSWSSILSYDRASIPLLPHSSCNKPYSQALPRPLLSSFTIMSALRHRISKLFTPSEDSGNDSVTSTRYVVFSAVTLRSASSIINHRQTVPLPLWSG